MSAARRVDYTAEWLDLTWNDGRSGRLPAIWLRDHCRCPSCRDAGSGQRLFNITDIDEKIRIVDARLDGDCLRIEFESPRHASEFNLDWLASHSYIGDSPADCRAETAKTLWDGAGFEHGLPRCDYAAYRADACSRRDALRAVRDLGFVLLDGLPAGEGQVTRVIETFGYVRETNYGRLFDVRSVVDPANLAYSNQGLGCHLDNPYRDPAPGLQLLHCLASSTDGGETLLQDGFYAAATLRAENHDHFDRLCRERVHFRFRDRQTDLRSRVALIETDERGQITAVRFNNRSLDSIRLPPERLRPFYRAYRHFAGILERKALQIRFKLQPGQMLLLDNTRVLHARTAYASGGERWLQGAYSDLDGLYSCLAGLESVS